MNPVSDGSKMPATLIPGDGIGPEIVLSLVSWSATVPLICRGDSDSGGVHELQRRAIVVRPTVICRAEKVPGGVSHQTALRVFQV